MTQADQSESSLRFDTWIPKEGFGMAYAVLGLGISRAGAASSPYYAM